MGLCLFIFLYSDAKKLEIWWSDILLPFGYQTITEFRSHFTSILFQKLRIISFLGPKSLLSSIGMDANKRSSMNSNVHRKWIKSKYESNVIQSFDLYNPGNFTVPELEGRIVNLARKDKVPMDHFLNWYQRKPNQGRCLLPADSNKVKFQQLVTKMVLISNESLF